MKAVLSNRLFLQVDSKLEKKIVQELTYRIPSYADPDNPIVIKNYGTVRPGLMSIPIGRTDLIPSDYELVDKRSCPVAEFSEFKGTLRESQQNIYDDISDNCLINAKVSWGKTFTGMAIAGKFGYKTLVAVHTIPLMHQWASEVRKVYGFEPGIIGGGVCKFSAPITIGNVNSLYTRMPILSREFGTIIMDEVHHAPSNTFNKVIDRSFAKIKIGLSGTLQRKDGKQVLIRDFFGRKVYSPPPENRMDPVVHIVRTGLQFPDSSKLNWAQKVTVLQDSIEWRNLITALTIKYVGMGHKVLVVADRVEMLKEVAKRANSALIVGETKDRDEQFASIDAKGSICGIVSIFKEGISHDPLSVIILATPINNEPMLEQLIGRIQRLCPGKLQPIVVDPQLEGYTVRNQSMNRMGHYIKQGYQITHF